MILFNFIFLVWEMLRKEKPDYAAFETLDPSKQEEKLDEPPP